MVKSFVVSSLFCRPGRPARSLRPRNDFYQLNAICKAAALARNLI